jgi:hypothetical protein
LQAGISNGGLELGFTELLSTSSNVVLEFTATAETASIILTVFGDGAQASFDNISVQKLEPIPMTTAVLVKMGVGSDELLGSDKTKNVLSVSDASSVPIYFRGDTTITNSKIISSTDYTKYSEITGVWDAGEYHLKLVQISEDGTQFRVGNKRYSSEGVAIDSTIVWSSWTTYDGSFDPLTYLRFGYSITVPIGIKMFQQWDELVDDAVLIKYVEKNL